MDACGPIAIVFPSLFAVKNEVQSAPCFEDPSCIGYLAVVSAGIAYVIYRGLTRGMSRERRREALWNFLFRQSKNKN